jgi:hypothetical protein
MYVGEQWAQSIPRHLGTIRELYTVLVAVALDMQTKPNATGFNYECPQFNQRRLYLVGALRCRIADRKSIPQRYGNQPSRFSAVGPFSSHGRAAIR